MIQSMRDLINACVEQMPEDNAAGAVVRIPSRPLMLVYLGEHDKSCMDEVQKTMRMAWWANAEHVCVRHYHTPQEFRTAIENDTMEDAVISMGGTETVFSGNNLIFAFFLNMNNNDAMEFINCLNTDDMQFPAGGTIDRFLFLLCNVGRRSDIALMHERMTGVLDIALAESHPVSWDRTYVFPIADRTLSQGSLTARGEKERGYALAMEFLLLYNTLGAESHITWPAIHPVTYVSEGDTKQGTLLGGAILRKEKPTRDIVYSVLYTYLDCCQSILKETTDKTANTAPINMDTMREKCLGLIQRRYAQKVASALPGEKQMRYLPRNADGTINQACAEVFRRKYFEDYARSAMGNEDELLTYFIDELGRLYDSNTIKAHFDELIKNLQDWSLFSQASADINISKSQEAAVAYAQPILCEAAKQLKLKSNSYGGFVSEQLAMTTGQFSPEIGKKCGVLALNYINASGLRDEMRHSCSAEELFARLQLYFQRIFAEKEELRYPYDQFLAWLTGDVEKAADDIRNAVVNVSDADMIKWIRMPILGFHLQKIASVPLINPDAAFMSQAGELDCYKMGRTDCVDRVAFYSYSADEVQWG